MADNKEQITTDTILESISDGVFTIDTSFKITSFNRAAEAITGIFREDAIGLPCSEVFKSNMCENNCPLAETFKSGKAVINRNGYIVDLEGKRLPVSVSSALLRDREGHIIGGAETFRDLREIEQLKQLRARERYGEMETNSEAMRKVLSMVPVVAPSSATLLILGESGTGKEVLARTIHQSSNQKEGPFIAVNCGALPDTLLESELFGYRKGAFTGADQDKPGRFALATGGTLFLDEIGDISEAMQIKLLRVLQEKQYEPLGSRKSEKSDARIICATNRDLEALVKKGTFRQDLYYRINIIALTIPPLRERKEDIPLLANQFLGRYNILNNKGVKGFSPAVYAQFYAYEWPGNVRELENAIERSVVLSQSDEITINDLPQEIAQVAPSIETPTQINLIEEAKRATERDFIVRSLLRNNKRVAAAANELGIHRSSLYRKMEQLKINLELL
ncbi:MAG: sigma-54 interaction domain-containing protein [Sphaerochaetaceae bacterium]|jgi:PAS domain S-box-containing protein|nr:sigma 54-interacting transcriptional regulator [Sphaerochaetaceae bacterium]HHU89143.1 sigma 54-interacting transcriptional regulator [Spirochaetales bacterium]